MQMQKANREKYKTPSDQWHDFQRRIKDFQNGGGGGGRAQKDYVLATSAKREVPFDRDSGPA